MSRSIVSRAATAAALLASTASAAFNAGSSGNVAMYWGQGADQLPLTKVCQDSSIDVVNIAFVNGFPKNVGDYPRTNFGNACWDYYKHPTDPSQDDALLMTCPTINEGIKICQANGKKVMLSLGGGVPTSYYLPSEPVAKYFAEFLLGAFGPVTADWTKKNGPRPFGDAVVDGFDLDLEAEVGKVPKPDDIKANYAYFVNQLKAIQPSTLISAAPQCDIPDPRLADAIIGAPFDMIFTQFYNTPKCSARAGIEQFNNANPDFTFKAWAEWLQAHSKNPNVKLYLGLPASPAAAPSYPDHYLTPNEAYALANKWRLAFPTVFGGIMLWEDKYSEDNVENCGTYSSWMKAILDGTFRTKFRPANCQASSSSIISSTPLPSSTSKASSSPSATPSATPSASSVHSSSSVSASSSAHSSSVSASSSSHSSSASASSSAHSSSASASSSAHSSSVSASSPAHSSSASASSSAHSSSVPASSSAQSSSSAVVPSSTPASSSIPSSSATPYPSGSVTYTPYPTGTPTPSIVYPQDTTKQVYPHSSETLTYSASSSSKHYPVSNATTSCISSTLSSSSSPAPVYGASSSPAPVYGASSSPAPVYGASSSPAPVYGASSSPAPVYGASSSPAPVYGASSSPAPVYGASPTPGYPVYGASSPTPGKPYDSYPASSSAKSYGGEYPPSVTSVPGKDYPSYPSSSTVTVITTTYVDSCETGLTTKTETVTQTVCNKCQGDSVTSVYVCNNCGPKVMTYTFTKPATPATNVPSVPTPPAKPSGPSYGGDKPEQPAKPSTPSYGGDKPSNPPTYDVPKKHEVPAGSTTVQIVYVTKTPVPVVPSVKNTPAPYPSAPAQNGGSGYPVKPTGTGAGAPPTKPTGTGANVPTKPTSYVPPAQFTGAASHLSAGMTGLLVIAAGLLVL